MNRELSFLDLSGFLFSGKHAVIELVREFEGYQVPHFEFEFCLIRVQDGIMDLDNAINGDWSPIRCPAAFRRFERLVRILGRKPTRFKLGYDYDGQFKGQFSCLAQKYMAGLVDLEWDAFWPFAWNDYSGWELFSNKVRQKLGLRGAFESKLYLASGEDFLFKTQSFLEKLFSSIASEDTRAFVLHNAIEPFNPAKGLGYFKHAKSIIVDRDPRDNYVASVTHSARYRKITAAHSVESFIKRYRLLRKKSSVAAVADDRVLRLRYEDLIFAYEATIQRILHFLGEKPSIHIRKKTHFKPEESSRFVGIFKQFERQSEIERIGRELPEYCYPGL
ncbi:MAG TPA: sulfotransferase [Bdellovibrionota bacterium]|nr:sulfotransferase [Bdellovibrionota bacterium]